MAQPLYRQIAEQLRDRILNGEYPMNSRIPTENELAGTLGVSRPTIRQALDLLEQEGRLIRIKGSGTFAAQPRVIHESTRVIIGYQEESKKNHKLLSTMVVSMEVEEATELVSEMLRLCCGEKVTRLTRMRRLENMYNEAPVVYTTVYVPLKLFPDMAQIDFTDTSFYEMLEKHQLPVVHSIQRLEVRMPPAEVAAGLNITPFEPTIYIMSFGSMADGRPIEYSESYYPASRSMFRIEINR